jgi:hypothetical protein
MSRVSKFILIALVGFGLIGILIAFQADPPASDTSAMPAATNEPQAQVTEGSGQVGPTRYTFMTRPDGTMVMFTTPLPRTDEALLAAMRHILTTDLGVEGRLTTRVAGEAVRWIAGSGVYDATPVRERDRGPVTGLVIQRR